MRDREIVVRIPIDISKWEAVRRRPENQQLVTEFEQAMEHVQSIMNASASEIEEWRQKFLDLAAEEPE